MKLKIITEGDPRLRKKSLPVELNKIKDLKYFIKDLTQAMYEDDGIGIASPQVGENIRLIVVATADGPLVMINPEIKKKSWGQENGEEGCLSVPGVFGIVRRHKSVRVKYYDKQNSESFMNAKGLMARVIQHEIDHIDGILFIDKAKNIVKTGLKSKNAI